MRPRFGMRISIVSLGISVFVGCLIVLMNAEAQTTSEPLSRVQLDESGLSATYANFSRVTGTPEELIFDFGLNANPAGTQLKPIKIEYRIVMNYYTAKRLLMALQQSVDRHEAVFGPIEVDVTKRVIDRP